MRIRILIEKKHLIFLCIFLVLVGSVFVIATTAWTAWTPNKPYHEILYTSIIGPKGDTVDVIFREDNSEDPNKNKIYSTSSGVLKYGTGNTRNIFTGKICSGTDIGSCISTEELINKIKEGSNEEGIFRAPIKRDWYTSDNFEYYIAARDNEATNFCLREEFDKMIRYTSSNNCPEDTYIYISGQGWNNAPCNENNGVLTYVKCENEVTTTPLISLDFNSKEEVHEAFKLVTYGDNDIIGTHHQTRTNLCNNLGYEGGYIYLGVESGVTNDKFRIICFKKNNLRLSSNLKIVDELNGNDDQLRIKCNELFNGNVHYLGLGWHDSDDKARMLCINDPIGNHQKQDLVKIFKKTQEVSETADEFTQRNICNEGQNNGLIYEPIDLGLYTEGNKFRRILCIGYKGQLNNEEGLGPGQYDIKGVVTSSSTYSCVIDHQTGCNDIINSGGTTHNLPRGNKGPGEALVECANRYLRGSNLGILEDHRNYNFYVCATVN